MSDIVDCDYIEVGCTILSLFLSIQHNVGVSQQYHRYSHQYPQCTAALYAAVSTQPADPPSV